MPKGDLRWHPCHLHIWSVNPLTTSLPCRYPGDSWRAMMEGLIPTQSNLFSCWMSLQVKNSLLVISGNLFPKLSCIETFFHVGSIPWQNSAFSRAFCSDSMPLCGDLHHRRLWETSTVHEVTEYSKVDYPLDSGQRAWVWILASTCNKQKHLTSQRPSFPICSLENITGYPLLDVPERL